MLYQAFFAMYGGGHILAGVLLWVFPSVLGSILRTAPERGAAIVIAMFNVMTGCGFLAALGAESPRARRVCLLAVLASDTTNALGHLHNTLAGQEPLSVGGPAVFVMVGLMPLIGWLWRSSIGAAVGVRGIEGTS